MGSHNVLGPGAVPCHAPFHKESQAELISCWLLMVCCPGFLMGDDASCLCTHAHTCPAAPGVVLSVSPGEGHMRQCHPYHTWPPCASVGEQLPGMGCPYSLHFQGSWICPLSWVMLVSLALGSGSLSLSRSLSAQNSLCS